jgi:hypothetical protein
MKLPYSNKLTLLLKRFNYMKKLYTRINQFVVLLFVLILGFFLDLNLVVPIVTGLLLLSIIYNLIQLSRWLRKN